MRKLTKQQIERFEKNIDKRGDDECWIWTNSKDKDGYGKYATRIDGKKKYFRAHRVMYFLTYGSIPEDKPNVLHHCDNPPCCNPRHLFAGTKQDNSDDMMAKGRGVSPNKGKKISDEHREKISKSLKGRVSPIKGKKLIIIDGKGKYI